MTTHVNPAEKIRHQIAAIGPLETELDWPALAKWRRDTEVAIDRIFGNTTRHLADFTDIVYSGYSIDAWDEMRIYTNGLSQARAVLSSIAEELDEYGLPEGNSVPVPTSALLRNLCARFHRVARQLRSRHESRPTLDIADEYDVQDLMHALLRLVFDDVRAEEWTPSYAGSCSRVDFLLKSERTVVEVKKTRKGLTDKEVGEQLIVDIERYKTHPSCAALFCFIYDPEGRISNPHGLESDLRRSDPNLNVDVLIVPRS